MNIIFWLWSHSPLLCLSNDDTFATLDYQDLKRKPKGLRFSLVSLSLGNMIIYLVSVVLTTKQISLFKMIKLEDYSNFIEDDFLVQKEQEEFKEHLEQLSFYEQQAYKEKLYYSIKRQHNTVSTIINKASIYTFFSCVMVLCLIFLKEFTIKQVPYYIVLCFVLLLYSWINVLIYAYNITKIRAVRKSTLMDLKTAKNKCEELVLQYRYDWLGSQKKVWLLAGYMQNLQDWTILTSFLVVAIYCLLVAL